MACAARNIHASPLDQSGTEEAADEVASEAVCSQLPPSPSGSSSTTRPARPRTRPRTPTEEMDSPKNRAASTDTVSGWESIITLPRPALVRVSPCASAPWNKVPSTRANTATDAQAAMPLGCGLPVAAA
jgi:hypothetical protein